MKLLAFDNPFPYDGITDPTNTNQDVDLVNNFGKVITEDNWLRDRLLGVFNLSKYDGDIFGYIQYVFNVALSIVGFVALLVVIYYFYMILFSKDLEWTATAKKALRWVLIALVVMGFSWLIVTSLFWIVKFVQG